MLFYLNLGGMMKEVYRLFLFVGDCLLDFLFAVGFWGVVGVFMW